MFSCTIKKFGSWYYLKEPISSYIDCVFVETYFSKKHNQKISNRIVPDNTVELILTDQKFERRFSTKNNKSKILQSHFSGLKTSWQDIILEGSPTISIRFKPEKIFQLTGIHASELKNQALDPRDVFGKHFLHFQDELFNLNTIIERLNLIQNYFTAKLKRINSQEDSLFLSTKKYIDLMEGNVKLKHLSNELKVSQKTLENKFNRFLGIAPKTYCRLIRFTSTIKKYNVSKIKLTNLAYQNNFSDQSHFIKDVTQFTGYSPKKFFSQSKGVQEDIF